MSSNFSANKTPSSTISSLVNNLTIKKTTGKKKTKRAVYPFKKDHLLKLKVEAEEAKLTTSLVCRKLRRKERVIFECSEGGCEKTEK